MISYCGNARIQIMGNVITKKSQKGIIFVYYTYIVLLMIGFIPKFSQGF
jgi:hypothetical protein